MLAGEHPETSGDVRPIWPTNFPRSTPPPAIAILAVCRIRALGALRTRARRRGVSYILRRQIRATEDRGHGNAPVVSVPSGSGRLTPARPPNVPRGDSVSWGQWGSFAPNPPLQPSESIGETVRMNLPGRGSSPQRKIIKKRARPRAAPDHLGLGIPDDFRERRRWASRFLAWAYELRGGRWVSLDESLEEVAAAYRITVPDFTGRRAPRSARAIAVAIRIATEHRLPVPAEYVAPHLRDVGGAKKGLAKPFATRAMFAGHATS